MRGAPAQALAAPPLRAPHGAPGGVATRAEAQLAHVPACERDVHAGFWCGAAARPVTAARAHEDPSLGNKHGGALARGVRPGAQLYMATWTTVGLFLIPILILIVFNIIY